LPEKQKPVRERRVIDRGARHPFRHTAKERKRSERHNERWKTQPGDQQRVECARGASEQHGDEHRHWKRKMPIVVRSAEHDG